MGIKNALFTGKVFHKRLRPKINKFTYKIYYFCLPLRLLERLNSLHLCAYNKINLFSINDKDHIKKDFVKKILHEYNLENVANGDVVILTLPRLLGYVFNPVTFWFCLNDQKKLCAVLCEVNNTFGENHNYICFKNDMSIITQSDEINAQKLFHVSPFLKIEGNYKFRFLYEEEKIAVWINYFDNDGLMLETSLFGKRSELNDKALLKCFFQYPLITFKVIFLIHWQAFKIISKGIKYIPKPKLPDKNISR